MTEQVIEQVTDQVEVNQVEGAEAPPVKRFGGRKKGAKNRLTREEKRLINQATYLEKEVERLKEENAMLISGEAIEKTITETEKHLVAEVDRLNSDIANLQIESAQLYHQIIGYKAVISYLEAQLGLKDTQ
jgi:molybdenum-dependent DNA-binding transcriptional regulator ModE